MEITHNIHPTQTRQREFTVEPQHTANHIGSGSVQVLATPTMIAFMEIVSLELLQQSLPEGISSVGAHLDVRHLAPSRLGTIVKVEAEVLEVEGKKIVLAVNAWEGEKLVGSGSHTRYLIDVEKFQQKLNAGG